MSMAVAYGMKRGKKKGGSGDGGHDFGPDGKCLAHGGSCRAMAEGGDVEGEGDSPGDEDYERRARRERALSRERGETDDEDEGAPEADDIVSRIFNKRRTAQKREALESGADEGAIWGPGMAPKPGRLPQPANPRRESFVRDEGGGHSFNDKQKREDIRGVHNSAYRSRPGMSGAGLDVRGASMARDAGQSKAFAARTEGAKRQQRDMLTELQGMRGKDRRYLAEGGMVGDDENDMVARIMKKRSGYSEGGMIANDEKILADFAPNEFDDLALEDGLESSYTGANSGDEIGNARTEDDDRDIVSRVMRSRGKKDRNPRPA